MNFLVDTFSWKKFDLLIAQKLITTEFLYSAAKFFITHTVKREIEHFNLESCKIKNITILPIKDQRLYQFAQDLDYDNADSEIFSNASDESDIIIISEDRSLLKLLQSKNFAAIQVIDFFFVLYKLNAMKSNKLYKVSKFCREKKNITEKKHQQIITNR